MPSPKRDRAHWAMTDGSLLCICGRRPGARPPVAPAAGGAPSAWAEFQGNNKYCPRCVLGAAGAVLTLQSPGVVCRATRTGQSAARPCTGLAGLVG